MASNKIFNSQPAVLATAALTSLGFNLFNCTVTTLTPGGIGFAASQPYAILKHIRLNNVLSTSAAFASLFKGGTLTSLTTQSWAIASVSIPAQSYVDWYGQARFDTADFLTGYSNLPNGIVISMEGEIGIS